MKERLWQICLIIAVIAVQAMLAPGLAKAQGAEPQPVVVEGVVPAPPPSDAEAPEPVAAPPVAPAPSPATDDQAFEKLLQQGANSDRSGAESGAASERDIVLRGGSESSTGGLWVLFLGAGVVLLAGWGFQHYRKHLSPSAPPDIAHIQSLRLGVKHTISIIEADGRRLLLGLSDGSIALLADLGRDDVAVGAPPVARDWKDVFAQARNQMSTSLEDDALGEARQVMRAESAEEPARAPVFAASSSRRAYEAVAAMKPAMTPSPSPEVSEAPREELPVAVAAPAPSVAPPVVAMPTPVPAVAVTPSFDPAFVTSTGTYRPPLPESYAPAPPEVAMAPVAPIPPAPMPVMPSVPGSGVTMPPVMPLAPMGATMAPAAGLVPGMPALSPSVPPAPAPPMAAAPIAMPVPAPMPSAPMPSPGAPISSPIAGSRVRVGIPGAPQTPPGYIGPGVTAVVASRPDRETDGVLAALKAMEARYSGEAAKKEGA